MRHYFNELVQARMGELKSEQVKYAVRRNWH